MHVYYFKFIVLSRCVWVHFVDNVYGIEILGNKETLNFFLYVRQKNDHMNPQIYKYLNTGADKGHLNNIIIACKIIMNIESWSSSLLGDH